jgi:hypothetical protein
MENIFLFTPPTIDTNNKHDKFQILISSPHNNHVGQIKKKKTEKIFEICFFVFVRPQGTT